MSRNDMEFEETFNEEEMEETARRRHARRKRESRLRRITAIVVLLVILAAAAVVYALVLVPRDSDLPWPAFLGKRPALKTEQGSGEKEEGITHLSCSRQRGKKARH